MNNAELWTTNEEVIHHVEEMYRRSDEKLFEIMSRMAGIALIESGQIGKAPDSDSGNSRFEP